ncbi:MAG: phage tail protein [Hyphomicrobiales bacterium]|nr:phage tail protein [Hyphomicrobiales bacterium]MDE2113822.1 phage tail protein [Hyphomicrobiales bacterium]
MSGNYQPILTNAGMAADAASRVTGAAKLTIAQMVIGDGGGNPVTPQASQTGLINPLDTFAVDSVALDPANPTVLMVTGTVPTAFAGGIVLREVGLILSNGTFYAVSAVPDTYIPLASQGAARNVQLVLKFVETNGTGNVTISANPAGWATQAWVSQQIAGLALPASEPHTFISDFNSAVQALIPPFPASETHTFISDFTAAAAAAAPVQTVNNVGPTAGTTNVKLTPANVGAVSRAGDTMSGKLIGEGGIDVRNGVSYSMTDLTAGADAKIFDILGTSGVLSYRLVNDLYTAAYTYMTVTRAGISAANISFNATIGANQYAAFNGGATFPGGATVNTMPAGDSSTNAASTAFVTAALAAQGLGPVYANATTVALNVNARQLLLTLPAATRAQAVLLTGIFGYYPPGAALPEIDWYINGTLIASSTQTATTTTSQSKGSAGTTQYSTTYSTSYNGVPAVGSSTGQSLLAHLQPGDVLTAYAHNASTTWNMVATNVRVAATPLN